jgi:hypothetical protein
VDRSTKWTALLSGPLSLGRTLWSRRTTSGRFPGTRTSPGSTPSTGLKPNLFEFEFRVGNLDGTRSDALESSYDMGSGYSEYGPESGLYSEYAAEEMRSGTPPRLTRSLRARTFHLSQLAGPRQLSCREGCHHGTQLTQGSGWQGQLTWVKCFVLQCSLIVPWY